MSEIELLQLLREAREHIAREMRYPNSLKSDKEIVKKLDKVLGRDHPQV